MLSKSDGKVPGPVRLAMILPHLGMGGAQRVAASLANHWANRGFDVHVVTLSPKREDFYELNPRIRRHFLGNPRINGEPGPNATNAGHDVALDSLRPLGRMLASADAYLEECLQALPGEASPAHAEDSESEPPVAGGNRASQILRQAWRSGDVWLLFALSIRIGQVALRYCIAKRALGRSPGPYLHLLRASSWRVSALRRMLRGLQPDVVLSFLGATNIMTIASAKGIPTRIVISERNDPRRQHLREPWQSLRPIIYPVADVVTANSHGAIDEMEGYCPRAKLGYVPNPVIINGDETRPRTNSVLFLARLVRQKGPDILIDAFATFLRDNPNWSLQIAGDGPLEAKLREQARDLGIGASVTFHGLVKDPTDLLLRSRLFVLPSHFEGTPNSLLEAMAARLACVVSDASPGPLKLIEHEVSGLVVKTGDADSLAAALHRLARNPALCRKLAEAAWERTGCFRIDKAAQDWEHLLFPAASVLDRAAG
jgi:glycosyltransferase involved in cell wall biosynthesis